MLKHNLDFDAPSMASRIPGIALAHIPEVITKELSVSRIGQRRKVVLSTNFLRIMGFEPGVRHDIQPLPAGGLQLRFNPTGSHKVYQRRYLTRKNNPFEAQIDIQNQSLLNAAIPSYTERVHFELRHGSILIRPLENRTFSIRRQFAKSTHELMAFVAMTGGIDVRCLMDCGFKIDSVLEYRPHEKRDSTDLTESGALNVLANANPRLVFNEDISRIDMRRVEVLMSEAPPIALLHISLQCDDFSTLKGQKARAASAASLDSSSDLLYDGLRLIETVRPACVMLEQVPGFASSSEGHLFAIKLRKWGYFVTDGILEGREHGGLTSRSRYYLVASVWPNFSMPPGEGPRTASIWPVVESHLADCREVSHTKSVAEGLSTGRIRLIRKDSTFSPTITKSQNRQCKDSVYIEHGGRYFLPSLDLLARLNGIPEDMSFASVGQTIQSEIIGQSIDYPMHERVALAVRRHIQENVGSHALVSITR